MNGEQEALNRRLGRWPVVLLSLLCCVLAWAAFALQVRGTLWMFGF